MLLLSLLILKALALFIENEWKKGTWTLFKISDRTDIDLFITDTDTNYLHVYVPDNRYAEPIFI